MAQIEELNLHVRPSVMAKSSDFNAVTDKVDEIIRHLKEKEKEEEDTMVWH